MEREHPEESDQNLEVLRAVQALPEALHFIETDELRQLRSELIAAMSAGDDTKELATRYRLLAEEVVNSRAGEEFGLAQIGLLVHIGLMRREGGRYEDYREDLEDAIMSAHNMGLDDVVMALEEILDRY